MIAAWIALAVGLGAFAATAGSETSDDLTLPGTGSTRSLDLLSDRLPNEANGTNPIVLEATQGKLTDKANSDAVAKTVDSLRDAPHVVRAVSPLGAEGANALSKDKTIGFISVTLDLGPGDLNVDEANAVIDATSPASDAGLKVSAGGYLGQEVSKPEHPPQRGDRADRRGDRAAVRVRQRRGHDPADRDRGSGPGLHPVDHRPAGARDRGADDLADARDDDRAGRRDRLRALHSHPSQAPAPGGDGGLRVGRPGNGHGWRRGGIRRHHGGHRPLLARLRRHPHRQQAWLHVRRRRPRRRRRGDDPAARAPRGPGAQDQLAAGEAGAHPPRRPRAARVGALGPRRRGPAVAGDHRLLRDPDRPRDPGPGPEPRPERRRGALEVDDGPPGLRRDRPRIRAGPKRADTGRRQAGHAGQARQEEARQAERAGAGPATAGQRPGPGADPAADPSADRAGGARGRGLTTGAGPGGGPGTGAIAEAGPGAGRAEEVPVVDRERSATAEAAQGHQEDTRRQGSLGAEGERRRQRRGADRDQHLRAIGRPDREPGQPPARRRDPSGDEGAGHVGRCRGDDGLLHRPRRPHRRQAAVDDPDRRGPVVRGPAAGVPIDPRSRSRPPWRTC